jgi:hypothetical protein
MVAGNEAGEREFFAGSERRDDWSASIRKNTQG